MSTTDGSASHDGKSKNGKPKIVICIDQGVVWSVFSDTEIVVICENLDLLTVHKVDLCCGPEAERKIEDLEFLAQECPLTKFDLIEMLKKKRA